MSELVMSFFGFFYLGLVSHFYQNFASRLFLSHLMNDLKICSRLTRRDMARFEARRDLVLMTSLNFDFQCNKLNMDCSIT